MISSSLHRIYESNRIRRRGIAQEPGTEPNAKELAAAMSAVESRLLQMSLELTGGEAAAGFAATGGGGAGEKRERSKDTEREEEWMGPPGHPFQPLTRFPARSDAWNTIMAWLHSRIPHTR
jgi:hypothetical protein